VHVVNSLIMAYPSPHEFMSGLVLLQTSAYMYKVLGLFGLSHFLLRKKILAAVEHCFSPMNVVPIFCVVVYSEHGICI
jgi:hypothetical protein